jgi:GT2 family glycosyltransferase
VLPDEVLIADDGSRPATRDLLEYLGEKWHLPIRYVWQPDTGFRVSRARNLAIKKTNCRYLIMIDGDCLIPPNFVENHLRLRKKQIMVSGGRFLLNRKETDNILKATPRASLSFNELKFWSAPLGSFIRDLRPSVWTHVRTCNFAVHREEVLRVGGFDESYQGWGYEDSDLVLRLLANGVNIRSGRLSVCVKHLHHPPAELGNLEHNAVRLRSLVAKVTKDKVSAVHRGEF